MNECKLARDLMIICADDLGSEDSGEFIAAHIEKCESCRLAWQRMQRLLPGEPEAEKRAEEYQKPLRWGLFRVIAATVLASVLALGIFGYLYWEMGFLGREEIFVSETGDRMFRVKNYDSDGFFVSGGASVVRPNGAERNLRGDKTFVDLHVWWAPNGEAYFAWWEFTDHDEAYYVDYRDIEAAGGWKNYLENRDLYKEDFFGELARFCRDRGIEGENFAFRQWSDDGVHMQFVFDTPDGRIGTVWYSLDEKAVTEIVR